MSPPCRPPHVADGRCDSPPAVSGCYNGRHARRGLTPFGGFGRSACGGRLRWPAVLPVTEDATQPIPCRVGDARLRQLAHEPDRLTHLVEVGRATVAHDDVRLESGRLRPSEGALQVIGDEANDLVTAQIHTVSTHVTLPLRRSMPPAPRAPSPARDGGEPVGCRR